MNNKRLYHIDGIKGLLCFFIMFGHFWNICRWSNQGSPITNNFTNFINGNILGETVFAATFWMYAFLVISGYLLSGSSVKSFVGLIEKTFKRYLRFFLLIFGSCVIIFALSKTLGFHTGKTSEFFSNAWFQGYYSQEYGLKSLIVEPIRAILFAGCSFNDPFWVMSDILISSVIIYFCKYIEGYTKKAPFVCLLAAILIDRHVIIACLAGFLLGSYKDKLLKIFSKMWIFVLASLAVFGGFFLIKFTDTMPTVFDEYLLFTLFYCFIILIIERTDWLQKFFSMGFFKFLGKISFGVYAFHWPIICSVGSLILVAGLRNEINGIIVYVLAFIGSVIATTALSTGYHFVVEKPVGWVLRKIQISSTHS